MKILDIAIKDMIRSFRSLFAVGMIFVAPLLITGLIYLAFGGFSSGNADLPVTTVAVVNLDQPVDANDFGAMLVNMFHDESVSSWLVAVDVPSEADAVGMVNQRSAGIAVIIPEDFTASIVSTESITSQVRLIQDPTLTIGPLVVRNMIDSLVDGVNGGKLALTITMQRREANGQPAQEFGAYLPVLQAYQDWYVPFQRTLFHSDAAAVVTRAPSTGSESGQNGNSMGRILALILAGQAIFFGFYTGSYAMLSILREQEEGTLARVFTTPTPRTVILGGKFLSVVLMVLVQALVMLVAGKLLFQVNWGRWDSVALAVVAQVLGGSSLGVLLISLVKTSAQGGFILGGVLTLLGMLGGLFSVAVAGMPKALDLMGQFTPQGWVLRGWKAALAGAAPTELVLPVLVVTGMAIVFFAAGASIFRRRFA